MTADLALLQRILQRELEDGCADAAVEGGIDELLLQQAHGEPAGSALLRMVGALPDYGYKSLEADERRTWVRRALATIAREQTIGPTPPRARNGVSAPTRTNGGPTPRPPRPRGAADKPRASAKTEVARQAPAAGAPVERKPAPRPQRNVAPGAAGLELPLRAAGTGLRAQTFARLERLGLHTVGDALRYYPVRHNDFSQTVPISQLLIDSEQTIRGTIVKAGEVRMGRGGRMRSTEITVVDEAGTPIRVIWFNQPFLARQFSHGSEIAIAGTVKAFRGRPTFENPEYELLNRPGSERHTGRLVPVYRLTEGLPQRTLRSMIAELVERFVDRVPDPLPASMRERHGLVTASEATKQIHYPTDEEHLREAKRRLAFDELLAIQLEVQRRKREWETSGDAPAIDDEGTSAAFLATLPYTLTTAQRRALDDVLRDLRRTAPMARLVEGDVGSGKTVVALAAMLAAVASGYQAVLMAPTEVLAEQHYKTICALLSGEPEPPLHGLVTVPFLALPLRVALLTGSTRARERRDALDAIRHGGAQIIVGTHALIEEAVAFQRLGLAVVDEQHRFGVMQRAALRDKGGHELDGSAISPHLLVMTATPIPRSLALTLYGDLDLSVIDELPPGRTPIETRWLPPDRRHEAFAHMRAEIEAGRQAFVICPLVEGSDTVVSRAATEEYDRLRFEEFPQWRDRIALLHGRMSPRDKDAIMRRFASGDAVLLVSTAVVEVGIDVPNATIMAIEGADRFGLAQLHQFRGRVGRGQHPSTCYLLADEPSEEAIERLKIVEGTRNGFELAEADLKLRGPGEYFGTRQSGAASLRMASLLDAPLIDATRREAERLLDTDPDLANREHMELRLMVLRLADSVVNEVH